MLKNLLLYYGVFRFLTAPVKGISGRSDPSGCACAAIIIFALIIALLCA
jgi:hypothetical protein